MIQPIITHDAAPSPPAAGNSRVGSAETAITRRAGRHAEREAMKCVCTTTRNAATTMQPDRIDVGLERLSRLAVQSRIDLIQYGQAGRGDITARLECLLSKIEVFVDSMPKTSRFEQALRRAIRRMEE